MIFGQTEIESVPMQDMIERRKAEAERVYGRIEVPDPFCPDMETFKAFVREVRKKLGLPELDWMREEG